MPENHTAEVVREHPSDGLWNTGRDVSRGEFRVGSGTASQPPRRGSVVVRRRVRRGFVSNCEAVPDLPDLRVQYEGIQADIFDHLLSVLPLFELRAYQRPAGSDVRAALSR